MKFNFIFLTLEREITPKNEVPKKSRPPSAAADRKKKRNPQKLQHPNPKKSRQQQQQSSRRGTIIFSGIFDELPERRKKMAQMSKLLIGFYDIIEPFSANRYAKL
jgi:hypothetical protein